MYREALSSVFASQVLTPLEEHCAVARVSLGLLTPVGHLLRGQYRPALDRIQNRCRQSRIDVGWIPSPPTRVPWLWSDRLLLRQWLSQRFPGDEPFIIRCRGAQMTCLALDAVRGWSQAKVIYDCRGAEVFEVVQIAGQVGVPRDQWPASLRHETDRLAAREARAVTQTAGVTCVSHAMVDGLRGRYPQVPANHFLVVPCCPHVAAFAREIPRREEARRELNLTDKFVVTYLGSLVWYQLPEESLRLFRIIRELRPDAHFLAITTDPQKMQALVKESGITPSDATIRSFPADEVPRWLVASDLGLMLRDTSETNRVASPVKFGEYLAAGVPVLVSPQLGDCTQAVTEHGLGMAVDLTQTDGEISCQLQIDLQRDPAQQAAIRVQCQSYAARELQWAGRISQLNDWYQEQILQTTRASSPLKEGVR